ncbi:peritrophin-44-like [Haliotis rubra]|uniref:peritrophin-44-like n=1 Tax=Haliotis rubra TaxID=36100 RepID=UPI001EE522B8|nr:peritrophin-44-like [Haliotis rubra]
MGPAVLGLLLGCLAITSAQVVEDGYAALCQNNYDGTFSYVAPGSGCKRFISCYGQNYSGLLQCPERTLFSDNTQRCEDDDKVDCRESFIQTPDCVTGVNPYNCSAFTYCHLGTQYPFSCNQELYYSESQLICVYQNQLTVEDRRKCNMDNGLYNSPCRGKPAMGTPQKSHGDLTERVRRSCGLRSYCTDIVRSTCGIRAEAERRWVYNVHLVVLDPLMN